MFGRIEVHLVAEPRIYPATVTLSNSGGIITLLDTTGTKISGTSCTKKTY